MTTASEELFTKVTEGTVTSPKGFEAGGFHAGLKRKRKDLGWIKSNVPAVAAGVFTLNTFQAPPLKVTKESLSGGLLQGIIVNSGNANAFTGKKGLEDAYEMRKQFAEVMDIKEAQTAVTSTGVIGEFLPMEAIAKGIKQIPNYEEMTCGSDFAEAIVTTDTITKEIAVTCEIDGKMITIGGAAKGSGMIKPNMATMLAFVTTDAKVETEALQTALSTVTDRTYNMITVDGETSTNDMVLLLANGQAENKVLSATHPDWKTFLHSLEFVCQQLAKMIAKDGEGATKLVEVHVKGAQTNNGAKAIAKSIVGSSLVKTAIYGTDANWGRIVCAIGYSGESVQEESLSISLGGIKVVDHGITTKFSEEEAKSYLENENIHIYVDLGNGTKEATAWGCDLTYDYVRINASYRT
ncbi:bifunctional ornithine acetyltransferase/N-acetylglutamate synthase [Bacillus sp. NTK071]|uniref:bifunctional ornithine acetyltransferase/N-acetylglutamate synthase n=1 Tax=Bacillus sp. NTK071 TaxID=2802175 RepID=UPI001A90C431|nr:bifunctional ornithine acetyltransferase/N-acetylglutamate synthase [Bacillus sp. NTK071]MBN8207674.1 bifunctional ornithine acetyltransferase/N-acetylglutamate synthase [Bacillus sp. NTK071]